jgi:hypothetical protein
MQRKACSSFGCFLGGEFEKKEGGKGVMAQKGGRFLGVVELFGLEKLNVEILFVPKNLDDFVCSEKSR